MTRYVLNENIAHYQKLIAASELDPWRDEVRHKTLLRLLDEEKAKIEKPLSCLLPQRKVRGRACGRSNGLALNPLCEAHSVTFYVRAGSKDDMAASKSDFRSSPESGHHRAQAR